MIPKDMTPDWAARKIIVAAYLYYVQNHSTMPDSEYDELSAYVAANWNDVDPGRQLMMGDPESTRAGGSHFKFSTMAVDSAISTAAKLYLKLDYPIPDPWTGWHWQEGIGRYITVAGGPKKEKKPKQKKQEKCETTLDLFITKE